MSTNLPRLSLGPVPYYWSRDDLSDFYDEAAAWPVDTVYLGETICSKRRSFGFEDWLSVADRLKAAGKEVVLSSMALLEAESELKALRRLCSNDRYLVEANDMGAVQLMSQIGPFVSGTSVNIYNPETLRVLSAKGLKRWVLPVELGAETLADMQAARPAGVETEVVAFGRLPLTYSARCFTARHHNLPKDDCQFRCLDYPEGLLLSTQEGEPFLMINGIQTLSARSSNLLPYLQQMRDMRVDLLRIIPQRYHTGRVVAAFADTIAGRIDQAEAMRRLDPITPGGSCDGYWFGGAGMQQSALPV